MWSLCCGSVGMHVCVALSRVSALMLTSDIDIAILSVCTSVRLSVSQYVTFRYCVDTA